MGRILGNKFVAAQDDVEFVSLTQALPNLGGSPAEHHTVAPAPISAPVTLYPGRSL